MNWVLTKRWLEYPKMKKLIEKVRKIKLQKSRNMCEFWTWNAFLGSVEHCGFYFRGLLFKIELNENHFYKKQITSKKTGPLKWKNG